MNNHVFVLYHGSNCTDGLGSKYAAWKKYGDKATYIAVTYGEDLPEELVSVVNETDEVEVYIIDFSYSSEVLDDLNNRVNKLMVLDHHKTSEEALRGRDYALFDMNKSGAVLGWEYFHPGEPVPLALQMVQDRDLWTWALDGTMEFSLGFERHKDDMSQWDKVCFDNDYLNDVLSDGSKIYLYQVTQVAQLAKKAKLRDVCVQDKKYSIALINSPVYQSELGELLSDRHPIDFALMYSISPDLEVNLSFRSRSNNTGADVGEIAKVFGGGGHRNASGARVDLVTFKAFLDVGVV